MKVSQNHLQVRGFFRGMSFPLLSYAAINSVFFGVYNYSLKTLHIDPSTTPSYFTVMAAGSLGGGAQLLVACPSDVVKCILQSQIPESSSGKRSIFRFLYFRNSFGLGAYYLAACPNDIGWYTKTDLFTAFKRNLNAIAHFFLDI